MEAPHYLDVLWPVGDLTQPVAVPGLQMKHFAGQSHPGYSRFQRLVTVSVSHPHPFYAYQHCLLRVQIQACSKQAHGTFQKYNKFLIAIVT